MASYRVFWTETARRDLIAIIEFIAADNPATALGVLERIQARAAALVACPERGRVVPELRDIGVTHYRELLEMPWRVIYRVETEEVFVTALLDSRRDLQSLLLDRLSSL